MCFCVRQTDFSVHMLHLNSIEMNTCSKQLICCHVQLFDFVLISQQPQKPSQILFAAVISKQHPDTLLCAIDIILSFLTATKMHHLHNYLDFFAFQWRQWHKSTHERVLYLDEQSCAVLYSLNEIISFLKTHWTKAIPQFILRKLSDES